jgi:alpha-mannosidase
MILKKVVELLENTKEFKFVIEQVHLLKLEPDNIVMTALKPSEDGTAIILRFYEASGEETEANITLFQKPAKAVIANLIEDELEELPFEGNSIKLNVKPFEIVTIKFVL